MRPALDYLSEEILTQIEKEEQKMLRWGFFGASILAQEKIIEVLENPPTPLITELADTFIENFADLANQIVLNLKERKLLFAVEKDGSRIRYRSRFAETIRLLYLLKQRFKMKDWSYAPNLVSNIKTELPYRKYPIRNRTLDEIVQTLKEGRILTDTRSEIIEYLLEKGKIELSSFQVDSLLQLLRDFPYDSGTIIGAGTGSGKTKAFYTPALTKICETVTSDPRSWTRMLGIYPRTELLKDQFREALSEIEKLNKVMEKQSTRPLKIGCYYGDIPYSADSLEKSPYIQWEKNEKGYICPTVTCLSGKCGGDMVWTFEDVQLEIRHNNGKHERLTCSSCSKTIESDNILLTRRRMEDTPPDILFTTTEMLNRKLGSVYDQHVFGIDAKKPPIYVLLDEVHIYHGVHGAHVSYVIKRWRHLVETYTNGPIHFVGLSATLPNPQSFFSQLVGVSENACAYITPKDEDMIEEGVEYNLVLRGDPFSSTALLSTSVQTAMLLARMLDPIHTSVSHEAWGSKVFGFTDKLDIINRWYHIELDAERKKVLSHLRDPKEVDDYINSNPSIKKIQNKLGQIWNAASQIDSSSLVNPLRVDITSSQQKGVNVDAKLVIATSTLEVGYNDPQVGAVIQHKAPHSVASFIQRKGRAGRQRGMRPWTVVITSAYGRDRFVYEYPEQLFSPNLTNLTLPTRNVYVQRIQVGYAIMDWFGYKLKQQNYEDLTMWEVLKPGKLSYTEERTYLADLILSILEGEDDEFKSYLGQALQLEDVQLDRILWTPPRSVMLHLLPTLYNQLRTNWGRKLAFTPAKELTFENVPLAGFVPQNLFSSLTINEIMLVGPNEKKHEHILQQGIIEFAPGNVSKRFVNLNRTREALWIDPGEEPVIDLVSGPVNGKHIGTVMHEGKSLEVIIPEFYKLTQIPYQLTDKSTGFLSWGTTVDYENEGNVTDGNHQINLLPQSPLHDFLEAIDVYIANENRYVKLTRYGYEVSVHKKLINGIDEQSKRYFTYEGKQASIGFQLEVDALIFRLKDISLLNFQHHPDYQKFIIESKPDYYLFQLQTDERLSHTLSTFEIEWLWQICFSSTIATAVSKQITIEEAVEIYRKNRKEISIRALDVIFQSTAVQMDIEDEDVDYQEAKLYKRLLAHIDNEEIIAPCLEHLSVLSEDLFQYGDYQRWLQERLKSTIAAMLFKSFENLLPDINTDNLIIDIIDNQIVISELDAGGTGVITSVSSAIQTYPSRFDELCSHALDYCPRHDIASGLNSIIQKLDDEELVQLFAQMRKTSKIEEQKEQLETLQKKLSAIGVTPKKELVVTLLTKLLHSNSNEKTDELIRDLHELWKKEEQRLGCKIDARIFTVASLRLENLYERMENILTNLVPNGEIDEKQIFLLVESLLWNNCEDSCPECLQIYSPFQSFRKPSRMLVKLLITPNYLTIDCTQPHWQEAVVEGLQDYKLIRVVASFEEMINCRKGLFKIMNTPVDIHFEQYYPYLASVHNIGTKWVFEIKIREVSHA
ncbi:protein DpdJ [Peribacillus simplex]|uniref:protein DpdJ n=1 Tax=Peribacillus simplex TaxID=1478 RepID=UPI0011AAD2EA|nr:protein DpdJ [Peribacillus simplex]